MLDICISVYYCIYRKRGEQMQKKMGRPTDDPKTKTMPIRFSKSDIEKLEYCTQRMNLSKAEETKNLYLFLFGITDLTGQHHIILSV